MLNRDKRLVGIVSFGDLALEVQPQTSGQAIGQVSEAQSRHTKAAKVPAEYPAGRIPLSGGEAGKPAEVVEQVLFLSSDGARHITDSPVWIDGAQSLLVG